MIDEIEDFSLPDDVREKAIRDIPGEILDNRGLPANLDAERTILGAILIDNSNHREAVAALSYADFYLTAHQRLFARMDELIESGHVADIVTVCEELSKRKEIESVGGVAWIASLTEGLPRRISITEYLRIVAEKALLRKLISVCSSAITRAADQSENAWDTLEAVERQFVEVRDKGRLLSVRRSPEPFFVGFRTFLSSAAPDVEWTVEGLIQKEGNGLIIGDSGTSKSLLVFDLSLHLVSGVAWFGHAIPGRFRVGLVAREDAPGLSQSRLKRLREGASEAVQAWLEGMDLENWIYINTRAQRETWTLQKEADIREVVDSIKEKGINIVFFDVFRVLWDGNENDSQETARVLEAAKRISVEAKCQVCIVHHLSKSDKGTIFDRARGGGINGWKEWGFGLTVENPDAEPKDQIRKIQFHTKADCSSAPIYYRIGSEGGGIRLDQVEPPAAQYNYAEHAKGKKKDQVQQTRMPYQD